MFSTFDILINYLSAMWRIDSLLCVTLGGNLVGVLSDVKLAASADFRATGAGGGVTLRSVLTSCDVVWELFLSLGCERN